MKLYPEIPGWKENTTSKDAALKSSETSDKRKKAIYKVLLTGSYTADEIGKILSERPEYVRSRLRELELNIDKKTKLPKPMARKTTLRRLNDWGNRVIVWAAIKEEKLEQQDWIKRAA